MKMPTFRTFRVYGLQGHRQKESFNASHTFSNYNHDIIDVKNSDTTGSNLYSEVGILTNENHFKALWGQLTDGIFENCKWGKVTELVDGVEEEVIAE